MTRRELELSMATAKLLGTAAAAAVAAVSGGEDENGNVSAGRERATAGRVEECGSPTWPVWSGQWRRTAYTQWMKSKMVDHCSFHSVKPTDA